MAKAILPDTIASISGSIGKLMFKTYKRANGATETRVYPNPYYNPNAPGQPRKRRTPVSANERCQRQLFAQLAKQVAQRIKDGDKRPKALIWQELKQSMQHDAHQA